MPTYTKPYLSLSDQLALLKGRGLQVANDAEAIESLHRNGYYRLSAYWYTFRDDAPGAAPNAFRAGSRFEDAVALYQFDKRFKLLLLDALERVEIAARVEIALELGKRDTFAHENRSLFRRDFSYDSWIGWISKIHGHIGRSTDEFVRHHKQQYGGLEPLPIWIAIELWDFGILSRAFKGMQQKDQSSVAARFGVSDWLLMESWLRTLNYVRNVIAHHGRLWNLNLSENPKLPKLGRMPDFDVLIPLTNPATRIYSVCCILSYLTRVINPQSSWIQEMKGMINSFPAMPHANIQRMGFPANWETHNFWL